jgi:hypothetical protein
MTDRELVALMAAIVFAGQQPTQKSDILAVEIARLLLKELDKV